MQITNIANAGATMDMRDVEWPARAASDGATVRPVNTARLERDHWSGTRQASKELGSQRPPDGTHTLLDSSAVMATRMSFRRNEEIYGEGEPAEYLYRVISGAVRSCKMLNDGRRQVIAFHLPGDILGLELGDEHSTSAEATINATVVAFKRSAVLGLATRDNEAARELWTLSARQLEQLQGHLLLLVKSAHERVAGFVIEMAARTSSRNTIELPMWRRDVADYLGLTIETVSRSLAQLERDGAIELKTTRHIVLRDCRSLTRLNGTRAYGGERKAAQSITEAVVPRRPVHD